MKRALRKQRLLLNKKMKKKIGKIILSCFTILLIMSLLYIEYHHEIKKREFSLYFMVGDNIIRSWQTDGIHYLFLPSFAKEEEILLASFSPDFYVIEEGESIVGKESIKGLPHKKELLCQRVDNKERFTLFIMQSSGLPTIFLNTNSNDLEKIKESKEYEVSGSLQIVHIDGQREEKKALKGVRTRGNTSFAGYEKKPFSISLKDESSLLGLPTGESYALLSNASDPSLIRNDIVRWMEEKMELKGSHRGRFVDLYIDGLYEGNYYLCDNIAIGEERISIENMEETMNLIYNMGNYESEQLYETKNAKARKMSVTMEDITGGYLMEREYVERYLHEYEDIKSGFISDEEEYFVVKNPKYCSIEQIEYIRNYINEAETAIMNPVGKNENTGKMYWEYIDLHSFAKKYLAEEISKNYDGGVSSSYYYKDSDRIDGKLYAAPGWDYDMTWGNYVEWMADYSADPEGIEKLAHHTYSSPWYKKLYEKEEFYKLITLYYREKVSPFLHYLVEEGLEEYKMALKDSAYMNEIRWKQELLNHPYYENREITFRELKDFMKKRTDYLDECWISS